MKQVYAQPNKHDRVMTIDDVPNIDHQVNTIDSVLSWLDTLIEVHNNEKNIRNK